MALPSKYPHLAYGAISKAYADVAIQQAVYQVPTPWLSIVVDAMDFVREFYPNYKISGFDVRAYRYGSSSDVLRLIFRPV